MWYSVTDGDWLVAVVHEGARCEEVLLERTYLEGIAVYLTAEEHLIVLNSLHAAQLNLLLISREWHDILKLIIVWKDEVVAFLSNFAVG